MKRHKINSGFSLIELVIVVAIVAILASVAIPSYFNQIQKARRADAMDALTDCAAAQARNYTTASPPSYLDQQGVIDAGLCNGLVSNQGHYTLTVANNGCTQNGNNWCFLITATPTVGGLQVNDSQCATWSIDHTDAKTAGTVADPDLNTVLCWGS